MLHDALLKENGSPVEDICCNCLYEIKDTMLSHIREHLTKGVAFHEWITDMIEEVLEEWTVECEPFITTLVHMEVNINRYHKDFEDQVITFSSLKPSRNKGAKNNKTTALNGPDFEETKSSESGKKEHKNPAKNNNNDEQTTNTDNESDFFSNLGQYPVEVESCENVTVKMLKNVFNTACNNIKDSVPKAIKFHFIKRILDRDLETEVLNKWDQLKEREREFKSDEEILEKSELFSIMNVTKEQTEKMTKLKRAEKSLKEAVAMMMKLQRMKKYN